MIEKDAYSLVSEILRPESFYERRHQLIYSAIVDLAVNRKPVDILTVPSAGAALVGFRVISCYPVR